MTPPPPGPPRGPARRGAARRFARAVPVAALGLLLSGCQVPTFGFPDHLATEQSHRTLQIWQGSCLAALGVGVGVWALILYAPLRYRRRADELPRQVRYNLPVEVLYTVVPFIIIAAMFFYTARDENYLNKLMPDDQFKAARGVTVDVIGSQWNWKFEYPQYQASVAGTQYNQAVLYLPVHRPVRFYEQSKDVIHSFWVVEFAMKRDVVPGRINVFEVTPDRVGSYVGRCAELCGYQHDRMNFTVRVLPDEEFDRAMAQTAASRGLTPGTRLQIPGGTDSNRPNGVGNPDPSNSSPSNSSPSNSSGSTP